MKSRKKKILLKVLNPMGIKEGVIETKVMVDPAHPIMDEAGV